MNKRMIFILLIGILVLPAYAAALTVKSVDFMNIDKKSRIQIGLDDKATYDVMRKGGMVILKIDNATLPNSLARPFVTKEFVTAVDQFIPKQDGKNVIFEIAMKQMAPYFISQDKNQLLLDFDIPADLKAAAVKVVKVDSGAKSVAADVKSGKEPFSRQAPETTPTLVGSYLPKYHGQPITLDFQNADIHNVLRIIADVSGLNIVTSDEVKGTITIRLKDVPWDQALDVILESKDLGKMDLGNVVRIAPAGKIEDAKKRMVESQKTTEQLEPLVTSVIPLNFASTKSIMENLEKQGGKDKDKGFGILSDRASVIGDERTNTLFVKDIKRNVDEFYAMIKRLDRPTQQVLISARIVQADTNFERGLGVAWGGAYRNQSNSSHFGLTGAASGSTTAARNLFGTTVAGTASSTEPGWSTSVVPSPTMAVNFPQSQLSGIGITLGRLAGSMLDLDLKLDIGETEGDINVISRPKVITLDNKKAVIRQGLKYPYLVRDADGNVSTELKDIDLIMEVTPRISFDGTINMEISVKRNALNQSIKNALGDPAIISREVQTEVLVKEGETSVLGGVLENEVDNTVQRVPFLGKLPIIGWLFKGETKVDRKQELLIFISPQVVRASSL
ncbi:MAG: type IV pilus secretin PilQ [Syntrophaceae bacterium]